MNTKSYRREGYALEQATESIAIRAMQRLWPTGEITKVTEKGMQLLGVDFIVYIPEEDKELYIDIKAVNSPDYINIWKDKTGQQISIETKQVCRDGVERPGWAQNPHSITDYVIYVYHKHEDYGIHPWICISYKEIGKIANSGGYRTLRNKKGLGGANIYLSTSRLKNASIPFKAAKPVHPVTL